MDEDHFDLRLGRISLGGSRRGRTYLHAVLAAAARAGMPARRSAGRFEGSRIGRGSVAARLLNERGRNSGRYARRAIVKTRLVRLGGRARPAVRAHLRYLERDGVSRDGAPGRLYSASSDDADGKAFLERGAGDRHQFRIIVSAADGDQYDDLRVLVRRFMDRMEQDLGTALDWVAVDHVNTLHPHSHILLRGTDDRGRNLVIAPAYIARGMRERVAEQVTLDLGPRSDLEIAVQARREVDAERLTALDRRLLRAMNQDRQLDARGRDAADHALRAGRLRKLERLGLAEALGGGHWRLAPSLEERLRALGERGDIIRTMQRALTAAGSGRAPADCLIHRPGRDAALSGRVIARGLTDELGDRHYLLIDGLDGRSHYVDVGGAGAVPALPVGAIVGITRSATGPRPSDQTIAAIAERHGGRYSAALHRDHDPGASDAFIAAHGRRLEALRRELGLERSPDGLWTIGSDYLDRVKAFVAARSRQQPAQVELLSPLPLADLPTRMAATWLDRELADGPVAPRGSGFGREVAAALALRRQWLLDQGFADERGAALVFRPGALALLRQRELSAAASAIAAETGKSFLENHEGERVEGMVGQRVDLASGRYAMIDRGRDFSLVPWRPVLERAAGRPVAGIFRERGTSWTLSQTRQLGR